MPTTRHRRTRALQVTEYGDAMRCHLKYGDCFLGIPGADCYCGLVLASGGLRGDLAKRMWAAHRAEILAEWKGPGRPWGAEMFDADE